MGLNESRKLRRSAGVKLRSRPVAKLDGLRGVRLSDNLGWGEVLVLTLAGIACQHHVGGWAPARGDFIGAGVVIALGLMSVTDDPSRVQKDCCLVPSH